MTANVLPRDEHVWFLLAESVRIEEHGKVSLLGFFGSEQVRIAPDAALPTGLNLTCVFLLREGIGTFEAEFHIRDPSGAVAYSETLAPCTKPSASENHGIMVTMAPFAVVAYGVYRITLRLDGKRYRRALTVIPDDVPTSVARH